MKNYKVKASQLYVGMDFYHVESSGAYSGSDVIVKITKTPDIEAVDEIGAKPAGPIQVETISRNGSFGKYWLKPGHQPATLKMSRLGSLENQSRW